MKISKFRIISAVFLGVGLALTICAFIGVLDIISQIMFSLGIGIVIGSIEAHRIKCSQNK